MHHLHIVSAKVWGGGESYVLNIAALAKERNDTVTVVCDRQHPEMARRFKGMANVVEVGFRPVDAFSSFLKIAKLIRQTGVSDISYHSGKIALFCVLLAKLCRRPCVFFKHNVINGKNDFYHLFLLSRLDAVVCVSHAVRDALIRNLPGEFHEKIRVLHTGIPLPPAEKRRAEDGRVTIGYAGRIVRNKGVELLLKACGGFPENVRCLIAGDTSEAYARNLVHAHRDDPRVSFCGQLSDLSGFYRSIDVFAAPSIVPEAFGLSVCEAMSFGLPVVTTTSGAQREIVSDGLDGILVEPNDQQTLSEALTRLVANPLLREKLGAAAREKIRKNFSSEAFYDGLEAIYASLADCPAS